MDFSFRFVDIAFHCDRGDFSWYDVCSPVSFSLGSWRTVNWGRLRLLPITALELFVSKHSCGLDGGKRRKRCLVQSIVLGSCWFHGGPKRNLEALNIFFRQCTFFIAPGQKTFDGISFDRCVMSRFWLNYYLLSSWYPKLFWQSTIGWSLDVWTWSLLAQIFLPGGQFPHRAALLASISFGKNDAYRHFSNKENKGKKMEGKKISEPSSTSVVIIIYSFFLFFHICFLVMQVTSLGRECKPLTESGSHPLNCLIFQSIDFIVVIH